MLGNFFLYHFSFDTHLIRTRVLTKLVEKYDLTLFEAENSLYWDKAIEGTETQSKIFAHNQKVIAGEFEGDGKYPSSLVLETIDRKIIDDNSFQGFLFFRYPLDILLWKKITDFLTKKNRLEPLVLVILSSYENIEQLAKQMDNLIKSNLQDYDSEEFYLTQEYQSFSRDFFSYFKTQHFIKMINIHDLSPDKIFEEISQVIDNVQIQNPPIKTDEID